MRGYGNYWILLFDSKSVNTLMASFWERKVVAVRVFFLSFYYPLISILTLHILTTYCATEMKGFPQHPLDGSFSIFFLSVLMFSLLITMGLNPFCLFVCFCGHLHKNPIQNYDFIPFLLCHKWKDFFNILSMAPSLFFFLSHLNNGWKKNRWQNLNYLWQDSIF